MLSIERAKQVALFVAMAGAMVYKFLEEIDDTKVKVITNAGHRVTRRGR